MNTELNNITILITGLVLVSIIGLILNNEMIVTTVIGGLIGYLSKDVNVNVSKPTNNPDTETQIQNNQTDTPIVTITKTHNTSTLGYNGSIEEKIIDDGDGDDTA